MSEARGGLPIAAYLGALMALALTAAFVAVVAIIIWLPPRPPDVMRADDVAEHFEAGYEHMREVGWPVQESGVIWSVRASAPEGPEVDAPLQLTQVQLAEMLAIRPDQVHIAASHIESADTFVFRVRTVEHDAEMHAAEAERLHAEVERARAHMEAIGEDPDLVVIEPEVAEELDHAVRRVRRFEVEAPEPPEPPEPPEALPAIPAIPAVPPVPVFAPAPPGVALISGFEVGAQLPDGRWLVMRQGRNWAEIGWIGRATLIIGGTLAMLLLLAMLFARRLTRPIRNFSDAVQAVGVDPQSAPVEEEGPRELRSAARAVNTMQARLRALIADRTKTLAAVAHDMRTPLMRLRLQAEHAPPEQRDRMAKEIEEVEALVAGFIAFARDDPAEEARVRLDLSALLQSIADDRTNVSFAGDERVVITGQSLGLKRLFANLVDNALKYGVAARIALKREEGRVVVDIEDDGPGVPADQRESVFEPFVRLQEGTSGAGLGLPAARSIARAHGGDIVILDAEKGALLRVTLPG